MKKEGRFRKLGRIRAIETEILIDVVVSKGKKQDYLEKFFQELNSYSFKYRKRNETQHEGCRRWIDSVQIRYKRDLKIPEEYALLIKAEMDGFFQKDHARSFYNGFVEGLHKN